MNFYQKFKSVLCAISLGATIHPSLSYGSSSELSEDVLDIVDACYLSELDRIALVGRNGLFGLAKLEQEAVEVNLIGGSPDVDYTSVECIYGKEAIIGGSKGNIYKFSGNSVSLITNLSDHGEPVLDITAGKNDIWVVGARGLLAKSSDSVNWKQLEIEKVSQPNLRLPTTEAGEFYLGVANIDPESFSIKGNIGGKKIESNDYSLLAEEGILQIATNMNQRPAPKVAFDFDPGPPFASNDVTWNVVNVSEKSIIIAGEFGLILESKDGGDSWISRNGNVFLKEPSLPYWLSGGTFGDRFIVAGAAGAMTSSHNGENWERLKGPTKDGIFGITVHNDEIVVLGAVGLAATLKDSGWKKVDRTSHNLLSWLKVPVKLPDQSLLVFGGRSTVLRKSGEKWQRLAIAVRNGK